MPPAEQVRDALDRLLASEAFARSQRARRLLRYLVEQQLDGNADRLKGYAIAVDALGRNASFDPSTDAVVRVQAGRLRELLEQYYAGEGAGEPLRIVIPRGSYVPDYETVAVPDAAPSTPEPVPTQAIASAPGTAQPTPQPALPVAVPAAPVDAPVPHVPERRLRPLLAAAAFLLAAFVVVGLYGLIGAGPVAVEEVATEAAEVTGSVPRETLPSVHLRIGGTSPAVQRVADSLRRGLAGFDTIDFIGRDHGAHDAVNWMRFEITAFSDTRERDVLVELSNAATGKVLVSRALPADLEDATDDMVADLLTITVSASGSLYAHVIESGRQSPLVECLVHTDRYYRDQTPQNHRTAHDCLQVLADAGSQSPLVYSELASLHMQAITGGMDHPAHASEAEALNHARRAIALGPNSPYAHRAMGYILQRTGKAQEASRWMQKAYELNPYDLSMAASYAYGLIFAGDYAGGTPVMRRAVTAASAHPTWWDYGLFLGHFMLGEIELAAGAVGLLAASDRAHYLAVRLIAADMTGRTRQAAELAERIRSAHPGFAADPGAFFEQRNYPPDLADRLVSALRQAGLTGST